MAITWNRRIERRFRSSFGFGREAMDKAERCIANYYARRASEYERVYAKPERQADLRSIGQLLSGAFAGDTVLEIACGTSYWTQFIVKTAAAVLATDYNSEAIDFARRKHLCACRV